MITSQNLIYSDKQAITATAVSTNVIDHGANGTVYGATAPLRRDQGKGGKVPLLIQITESFAGATALTVEVQVSATENFASPRTVASSTRSGAANLVAGSQFAIDELPLGTNERYSRLNYVPTGTVTAGRVTAEITMGNQQAPL